MTDSLYESILIGSPQLWRCLQNVVKCWMDNKQVWDDRTCRNPSFILAFRVRCRRLAIRHQLVSIHLALILVEWPDTFHLSPMSRLRSFDSCPVHGRSCDALEISILSPLSSGNTNTIPDSDFGLLVAGMSSGISPVCVSDIADPGINSHATQPAPERLRQAYAHNRTGNKVAARPSIIRHTNLFLVVT